MPSGEQSPVGESRKRTSLVIAAIVVVIIVVVAALAITVWPGGRSNSNSNGNINTDVINMIIQPTDLPTGWTIASPFYPGYQGTLPGNYSQAGGIGLNLTQQGQEKMYLIVLLVKCANTSQAHQMWIGMKAVLNNTMTGNVHATDFADLAMLSNLTNTGQGESQGKYLWFMDKNVICGMIFTFEKGYTQTDQQLLEIANLQLEKIK
jgi:hypothetical protein